jgi:prepilin signal peptidase PulO-like enzyme (type II secretory pathway)
LRCYGFCFYWEKIFFIILLFFLNGGILHIMELIQLLVFSAFALIITVIDIRSLRIPDLLVFPCYGILLFIKLITGPADLPAALAASFLCGLLFYIIRRIAGGLGIGDIKYAALIGLFCGLPWVFTAFLTAAVLGLLAVLVLRLAGKFASGQAVPFGPFLSIGAVAAWCLQKYFTFFLP